MESEGPMDGRLQAEEPDCRLAAHCLGNSSALMQARYPATAEQAAAAPRLS